MFDFCNVIVIEYPFFQIRSCLRKLYLVNESIIWLYEKLFWILYILRSANDGVKIIK